MFSLNRLHVTEVRTAGYAPYGCGAHSGKLAAAEYALESHIKLCVKIATSGAYALGSHSGVCTM